MSEVRIIHGDCIDVMSLLLDDESVDAIVTDPPYGLGFMGKKWDDLPPGLPWAQECLRVLKPGGHLLAFGGTRTWHRLACAVEDAGFEVRDSIAWMYGSGFPKSLDVSKAIDKKRDDSEAILAVTTFMAEHAERQGFTRGEVDARMGTSDMGGWWLSRLRHRCACPTPEQYSALKALLSLPDDLDAEVMRLNGRKGTLGEAWQNADVVGLKEGAMSGWNMDGTTRFVDREEKAPATPEAERWKGWGTALKPAFEPVVVARKPLVGTVASNVLAHGTGALNIDGCRVGTEGGTRAVEFGEVAGSMYGGGKGKPRNEIESLPGQGRWPANVVLDESQAAALDEQSGERPSGRVNFGDDRERTTLNPARDGSTITAGKGYDDLGGASRFFYVAKAPKRERPVIEHEDGTRTVHTTVKPLTLMRYLVRLVTPPGGTVLEPFAGSGTTVEAALLEGFDVIGIEREAEYLPLIQQRIDRVASP